MYRTLFLLLLFTFSTKALRCQEGNTLVEIDIVKIGISTAFNYGTGLLLGSELRYYLPTKFALGLKADYNILGNRLDPPAMGQDGLAYDGIYSVGIFCDYRFSDSNFNTGFLGLGLGYNKGFGENLNDSSVSPIFRLGLLFKVRLVAEYNLSLNSEIPSVFAVTITYPITVKRMGDSMQD